MPIPCIYKIESPSNKVYIGQSRNYPGRLYQYNRLNCKKQAKLYESLKKYGPNNHFFEVLLTLKNDISQPMLDYWEQLFMDIHRQDGVDLLNLREGGFRGRLSDESIQKLRSKLKGVKRGPCPEQKKINISKAKKGRSNGLLGYKLNDTQKKALMAANLGVKKKFTTNNKHSLSISGENSNWAKLNNLKVRIIMHLFDYGEKGTYLSKIFNVSTTSIYSVKNGETWSHVTGIYCLGKKYKHKVIKITY